MLYWRSSSLSKNKNSYFLVCKAEEELPKPLKTYPLRTLLQEPPRWRSENWVPFAFIRRSIWVEVNWLGIGVQGRAFAMQIAVYNSSLLHATPHLPNRHGIESQETWIFITLLCKDETCHTSQIPNFVKKKKNYSIIQKNKLLHPPKKAMLIGRIADIIRSGRGPGFVS